MASSSPTEIESLRRQHNSLTFQLARVTREHELELCAKDKLRASIVLNRDKRYKKTGAELAAVRSDRADLKRSPEAPHTSANGQESVVRADLPRS